MVATASACQARGLALGISPWGTLGGALSMSRDTEEHGTTATCVANFQGWMRAMPVVADGSRVFLDQALYSFDLSEYGLVGAFSTSGCLYAVTAEQSLDFRALFESLADSGIEVWVSTPSFEASASQTQASPCCSSPPSRVPPPSWPLSSPALG